ncbi:hypothetical protein HPB50_005420 [Hyalomma asiaticum]|uniref:Uncharacterized protein n=1 Tax=Hyalomma asiaticum TaxID=266040 RepID=A0ACB7RKE5_HYAAI|nr:hypothetical protein HPB50_005420 [Hyalomma asiaticum]
MGEDDESSSKRRCLPPRHALYPVDIVYHKNPRNGEPSVYVFAKQVGAHLDPNERRKLVVLEVTGWMPYMFLKVEDDDVQKMERTVREFLKKAHQSLQDAGNINFKHTIDTSSDLKFLDGYGYRPDDAKERFIKVSISDPKVSESGRFPKSHKKDDSIIQITSITTADVLCAQPGIEDFQKCVFVLGSCDFIDDADVRCYDGEKEMLEAFREHVVSTDPDIITGYKVRSFDWPYILDRFKIFQMWAAFHGALTAGSGLTTSTATRK